MCMLGPQLLKIDSTIYRYLEDIPKRDQAKLLSGGVLFVS